jgi:hypothetical protein
VVADRLIFYGIKHNLIPHSQFRAMPGRSTVDAALCLTHDIKAADNHNLCTSMLTFDITGYFDNINHKRLLMILRQKGVPLPLCKWVYSFLSKKSSKIHVDGMQSKAKPVRTGCPQGSPILGVLANFYSAPLLKAFSAAADRFKNNQYDIFNDLLDTPYLQLPTAHNSNDTRTYSPKESARWLGIIFDLKLTFDQHIKHLTKCGTAMANCLEMLANTVGGLTQDHIKTLYTACVLLAITYTVPVWWTGKKGHVKQLSKVQNQCLHKILPVFSTTPVTAMETEAGIPPLHLRLNRLCA